MQDEKHAKTITEKNAQLRGYQYKKMVTLTKPEGALLDKIISDNGCNNLSQLCKKIVKGEISIY